MPADSPPRSLEAWLELLGPLQPPVDAAVRGRALTLLNQGAGSAEVARQLALDPAAAMLVFRSANQALARYDREAHTLDHAIGLLGIARVQTLLEQAPLLAADHPHATAYRQMLLRSRHAAQQALLWAEGTGLWPAEEVFWSTLVAAAPLWLLWLETGATCERLERRRARQGAIGHAQVVELLGCEPLALGAALAQQWLLPEMSRQSWQRKTVGSLRQWVALERLAHLDEPPVFEDKGAGKRKRNDGSSSKELHELCHRPALVVAVANALAAEADWDWQSRRCLRLMSVAAAACRRPLATLLANGHQVAATLSREAGPDLLTPAARLLGEWRQAWFWQPPAPPAPAVATPATAPSRAPVAAQTATPTAPATAATAPATPAPAIIPGGDAALLVTALQRLRVPGAIDGTRAALELVLDALQRGAGLKRGAALLVRNGSELQTVLSVGAEQAPALRQFRYAGRNNQLLMQLLGKPVCLRLNKDNRAKFWLHLPEEFRAAIGSEEFLLMAAFAGDRPVALLYADNNGTSKAGTADAGTTNASDGSAGTPGLSDRQHQAFKQLCQQLSACLTRLAGGQ